MRRKIAAAAAMLLFIVMTACAGQDKQTTFTGEASEEPAYQASLNQISPAAYGEVRGLRLEPGSYISIIGKSEGTAFWKAVRNGVMQAAEDLNEELGYTGSDKIKVTYNAPAREEDIDEQVNILDEELSRYPDVIGIASIDEEACTVQFDLATENGIPIIALDSGNLYQGIQCTVKTDNQDAARTGAYKLADEIGKKGDVMILVHDSKSETARERVNSFQAELADNYPDVNVSEVVYCDNLDDIKTQMAEEQNKGQEEGERKAEKESFSNVDAVQYMIEQHPGLKGIFATNDGMTRLALEAMEQAEKAREERKALEEREALEERKASEERKTSEERETSEEDEQKQDASSEPKTDDGEAGTPAPSDENKEAADTSSEAEKSKEKYETPAENEPSEGREGEENEDTEEETFAEMNTEIVLMGFDTGKEQLQALEAGELSGLVVQNPFGIGYASVVAAARTVQQAGNEAQVSTGYLWVTKDNMNDESIREMLYE